MIEKCLLVAALMIGGSLFANAEERAQISLASLADDDLGPAIIKRPTPAATREVNPAPAKPAPVETKKVEPVVVAKPAPVVEEKKPEPLVLEKKEEPVVEETVEAKEPPLPRTVRITSDRTDYDRKEGVIMFDKNVVVDDPEYKMHAEQLYVFLDGTNELKRIVAMGNVAITNELRVGHCAKAAYTKATSKIVMYGDGAENLAVLSDLGKRKSEVKGRKITFWIDSEQVEVEGSTVTLDAGSLGGKEGAKKILGK